MKNFVVTIDGPAGSGKTTVARELGLTLNWFVLESGTLYRVVALLISRARPAVGPYTQEPLPAGGTPGGAGGDARRESKVFVEAAGAAAAKVVYVKNPGGKTEISIDGEPVGAALKSQKIGELASILAADAEVRRTLLPLQRSVLENERFLIAEGRDMGTNVFYDADIKFFLTASLEVRASRRLKELSGLGFQHTLGDIIAQIRERDERDEQREVAPLMPAGEAVIIDTSDMSIRQVVSEIMDIISPRVREEQESELYETRFRD